MDYYCDNNDDEVESVEERINASINPLEGWIKELSRIVDGDIEGIPSWMTRKQCVASICDSIIANMKYIKKQI